MMKRLIAAVLVAGSLGFLGCSDNEYPVNDTQFITWDDDGSPDLRQAYDACKRVNLVLDSREQINRETDLVTCK